NDNDSAGSYVVLIFVNCDSTEPAEHDDQHIDLVVDVCGNALTGAETEQVGVELFAGGAPERAIVSGGGHKRGRVDRRRAVGLAHNDSSAAKTIMKGRPIARSGQDASQTSQKLHASGRTITACWFWISTACVGHSSSHRPQPVQRRRSINGRTSDVGGWALIAKPLRAGSASGGASAGMSRANSSGRRRRPEPSLARR